MPLREPGKCCLCKKPAEVHPNGGRGTYFVVCSRCGEYGISEELERMWPDAEREKYAPALSGLFRELKENEQDTQDLLTTNYQKLASSFPVPNMEDLDAKLEKLLFYIKRKSEYFGQPVAFTEENDYPIAYAKNREEFAAFIQQLKESKFLSVDRGAFGVRLTLSAEGWNKFSRIVNDQKLKQGFVAAWFDDGMDDSINVIKLAIEECGFSAMCIKKELYSETIMDKALGELKRSRFTVIDLTGERGSVFFEAGFAKALNIEAIYVYQKGAVKAGSQLEFYVRHYQCHAYSDLNELREIIVNAIRARVAVK
jgi:hypothetical protein